MKNTQKLIMLFLSALSIGLVSCDENWSIKGEGPLVNEARELEPFSEVESAVPAEVYIRQGAQEELRIEAQPNILKNLETRVTNGHLLIKFDENVRSHDGIKIWITIPEIRALTVSGSGALYGQQVIIGEQLEVNTSGSGAAWLEAEMERVETNVSGSGEMKLAGSAEALQLKISGSGEIDAQGMPVQEAEVQVSGSGDCRLHVKERLDVTISGSGDVSYKGVPVVNSRISGSGDLHKL